MNGLQQWVEDYQMARKYGSVKLAKQLKRDIDGAIRKLGLKRDEVYRTGEYHASLSQKAVFNNTMDCKA